MGCAQSEISNGASQVPDDKAPGRDVRNELASTPSDIVSDGDNSVNRNSVGERNNQVIFIEVMTVKNGAVPFKTGALKEGKPSGTASTKIIPSG